MERLSQDRGPGRSTFPLKWQMTIFSLKTAASRAGQREKEGELKPAQDITDILSERFGVLQADLSNRIAAIDDPDVLRTLLKKSINVTNLEEFVRMLKKV